MKSYLDVSADASAPEPAIEPGAAPAPEPIPALTIVPGGRGPIGRRTVASSRRIRMMSQQRSRWGPRSTGPRPRRAGSPPRLRVACTRSHRLSYPLAQAVARLATTFVDAVDVVLDGIIPSEVLHFESLNRIV